MDSSPQRFPLDFENYLKEEDYSVQHKILHGDCHGCIFRSSNRNHLLPNPNWDIADKIHSLLTRIPSWVSNYLFQFWTAVIGEDRCLLTTRNQPFSLNFREDYDDRLYKYRMVCKDYECYVDSDVEEGGLGIIGRVFRHKSIEATPNVEYYTIQQYPLRDVAGSCGIQSLIAVPVFEPSNLCCVGVLEFVYPHAYDHSHRINEICKGLGDVGLEPPIVPANHWEGNDEKIDSTILRVKNEIKKTFEASSKIPGVRLCQAWAPCTSCSNVVNGDAIVGCLCIRGGVGFTYNLACMSDISFLHHLRKGQGIVGRAFSSGMLTLCTDITKLSIIDYPLAHFAYYSELDGCLAIPLQSNHIENNVYILEFFFTCSGDPHTLLYKILENIKKHLLSFKVTFGQELGAKLPIMVIDSQMNERLDSIQIPNNGGLVQHTAMAATTTGMHNVIREQSSMPPSIQRIDERALMQQPSMHTTATRRSNVIEDSNNNADFVALVEMPEEIETVRKQCRKSGIPISLEDIQQQFGKKLQDAAASLGVSRSTLKRACREYEISWWRPGKRNSGHHAANNASNEDVPQDQVLPPSLNLPYQPPVVIGTSEMQNFIPLESTNNVNVKVRCDDKFAIKFQLSLSSGLAELKQQVVKRLNEIDFGNYSFLYKDEENEWIAILCDEDLHYYLSSSTSSTKTSVTIDLKPFKLSM